MPPRTRRALVKPRITVDAFLADSVVTPGDGKIYVQGGGWTILHTTVLPARHPRLGVAVLITVPYLLATNEPHRFALHLEDADRAILPLASVPPGADAPEGKARYLRADFAVGRPVGVQVDDDQAVTLAINLDGLVFERAGTYSVVIEIDDEVAKRLRFRVNLMAGPPVSFG